MEKPGTGRSHSCQTDWCDDFVWNEGGWILRYPISGEVIPYISLGIQLLRQLSALRSNHPITQSPNHFAPETPWLPPQKPKTRPKPTCLGRSPLVRPCQPLPSTASPREVCGGADLHSRGPAPAAARAARGASGPKERGRRSERAIPVVR